MGAFQSWLEQHGDHPACCPDPEADAFDPEYDDLPRQDDDGIAAHGYDSRCTPVDVLMAGPVSMGLAYANDMRFGDYA